MKLNEALIAIFVKFTLLDECYISCVGVEYCRGHEPPLIYRYFCRHLEGISNDN